MAHAKEKWEVNKNIGKKSEIGVISDKAPCIIAIMGNSKEWPEEAAANARLIAAAPELLAACENVLYITHNKSQGTGGPDYKACFTAKQMNEIGNVLRAAIAVARGE